MSEEESLPLRAEVARKALHAATAVLPVALSFAWCSQASLRIAVTAAVIVALLVEMLRRLWPAFARTFSAGVGGMLRTHERSSLTGATWLAISMALVLWLAPLQAAIAALWGAAVGDSSAAIAGRSARHLRGQSAGGKTLVGSFAAFAATAAGVLWLTPASVLVALALGVVAAIVERPAVPLDDNLRIAFAVALAATGLGLR